MSKFKDIITGWAKLTFRPERLTPEEENRLEVCDTCPFRKKHTCSDCGCFIPAKIRSDSKCPQDKW